MNNKTKDIKPKKGLNAGIPAKKIIEVKRAVKKEKYCICSPVSEMAYSKKGKEYCADCDKEYLRGYDEISIPELRKVDIDYHDTHAFIKGEEGCIICGKREIKVEEKVNWYLIIALALGCLLVLAWGTGIERAVGM